MSSLSLLNCSSFMSWGLIITITISAPSGATRINRLSHVPFLVFFSYAFIPVVRMNVWNCYSHEKKLVILLECLVHSHTCISGHEIRPLSQKNLTATHWHIFMLNLCYQIKPEDSIVYCYKKYIFSTILLLKCKWAKHNYDHTHFWFWEFRNKICQTILLYQ